MFFARILHFLWESVRHGVHSSWERLNGIQEVSGSMPLTSTKTDHEAKALWSCSTQKQNEKSDTGIERPWADFKMMKWWSLSRAFYFPDGLLFLRELSNQFPDDIVLLCCDGAAWHKSRMLDIPENIVLFYIAPSYLRLSPLNLALYLTFPVPFACLPGFCLIYSVLP